MPKKKRTERIRIAGKVSLNDKECPCKMITDCTDVTGCKQAEKKLQESEEKFSTAFQISPSAIAISRAKDGKFIDFNDAFSSITGYTRNEALSNTSIGLKLWVSSADRNNVMSDLIQGKKVMGREFQIRKKNGEILTGLFSAQFLNSKTKSLILSNFDDITDRKQLEKEREQKRSELEDVNTALTILLKKKEENHQEIEKKIYANYEFMILPFLNRLQNSLEDKNQQRLLNILETNLNKLLSPFAKKLSDPLIRLTASEIQIASMIKQGLTNKEMSQILYCSVRTVDTHRGNIRKKLNLKHTKHNLRTYLSHL